MEAVNNAYNLFWYRGDIDEQRKKKEPVIKLILEKVDHDSLDLKEIMNKACLYDHLDVVTFLLENTEHEKLYIMEAVNNAYNLFWYRGDIDEQREKKEPLIKLIIEKVDHDLLDLKEIMNKACRYGYLDVVTFLLENTDHEKLHIMGAVNNAGNLSIDRCNEKIIETLLQKVKTDLFDMEILMNVTCRNGWLNIVRWLVENIDHSMFDVDTAFNLFIPHDGEETLDIFKLLLQIISPNLFNIGTVIEQASRLNHTEKVLWLLQNKDSSLFEMKYVMNEACRNSNLQIMKYVMDNMDRNCVDARSSKMAFDNIPHDMLDLESAMNNACRYDNVVVVQWFWNNLDRQLFDVKTAWNNACYNCNEALLSYLLDSMDVKMLDTFVALSRACRNIKEGDKIMSLLFEQLNVNTPENCKLVLKESCVHCNRKVVKWLLSNTDIQPLVYKESLIDMIKATINMTNNMDKSDRVSMVQFLLEHDSIRKLRQNDMTEVMEAVSSIGQLDMVRQLWDNNEQSMFNTRAIVNTACESGQFEIVDWFLQNIELKNIDVQTVMVEACGYGWLTIVKLLWSNFDKESFDIRTLLDDACSYGRYDIVKFLLENADSKLLDAKLVLEKSCGYGWKDIILWLFANIETISIDLKTCMFEACAQGRLAIVELFC
ncbi:unnamed protein product [Mytilus edulis]|uniref:Ankyrin repeat protein n=1 Tax=Mytilus edulis TaxID=6550 RepID=A0A8S3RMZ2_MYTED|nr:unnamed protein product [Mytilus edulis]